MMVHAHTLVLLTKFKLKYITSVYIVAIITPFTFSLRGIEDVQSSQAAGDCW